MSKLRDVLARLEGIKLGAPVLDQEGDRGCCPTCDWAINEGGAVVVALEQARALLEQCESIMWMAREYAEAGGTRGPEMRDYQPVEDALREALAGASTPKP